MSLDSYEVVYSWLSPKRAASLRMRVKQLEACVVRDQVLPSDHAGGYCGGQVMGLSETGEKKGEKSPRGSLPHCGKKQDNIMNMHRLKF